MMRKEFRIPQKAEVADRKVRFSELVDFVRSRNGWITSIPGAVEMTIECLPGSGLPEELRGRGYDVTETEGERILATAITERLTTGADGHLEPVTAGSIRPVALTVAHAGIYRVIRYFLRMV